MSTSDDSYADFKLEFIHKKWSKLLLKWINKCVHVKGHKNRARRLDLTCLEEILKKYKEDVCEDDFDRAVVHDVEPFILYKYPTLRLRYLSEDKDLPKKLYIMTSVLLYHCCMKSHSGLVHEDIYHQLTKDEQELILKFCERLTMVEITINNVEVAIIEAFECVLKQLEKSSTNSSYNTLQDKKSSDTAGQMSSTSTDKSFCSSLPSDATLVAENAASSTKVPLKFTSDLTVLSSVVTDTSFSAEGETSGEMVADQEVSADSCQINLYGQNQQKPRKQHKKEENEPKHKKEVKERVVAFQKDKGDANRVKDFDEKKLNDKNIIVSRQQIYDTVPLAQTKKEPIFYHEEGAVTKDREQQPENPGCVAECSCARCSTTEPCCGDPGGTLKPCDDSCDRGDQKSARQNSSKSSRLRANKIIALVASVLFFFILTGALVFIMPFFKMSIEQPKSFMTVQRLATESPIQHDTWECINKLCQKVHKPKNKQIYLSQSRCTLMCTGPQIWPLPIGESEFSSTIIALATGKLEYKLKTIPSEALHRYTAEALKLFIGDMAKLEKTGLRFKRSNIDLPVMKMNIQILVDTDPDPRMRLNTEESYKIELETMENQVVMKISSSSFCGVRHGLETLTQMILLDEYTGHLITVSTATVKDSPSFKYRGLMIDTGRNYIPVDDLMRTLDAMATVKLNTFHWRVSDATSFPLYLPNVPQLFEHGAYDKSMVYTKDDVKTIVKRAGVRGIRVLMEIAAPGPVGRPWSWSSGASCPSMKNSSCDNDLCTILAPKSDVLNLLHDLYKEIIEITEINDIFHLSNGVFSLNSCFNLMKHRDGFLDKALDILKDANKGFLPKLPIIWYTPHLNKDFEAKTWERFGVQLNDWKSTPSEQFLAKFKVIHSSRWELSCETRKQRCKRYRSWQEMYSWKTWRNLEAFSVEGGEVTLWTDMVDSSNLDYHLWPRTAAVAERLWSDIIVNATADGSVYTRLNGHRSRMLRVGVKTQAIWPAWCNYNPGPCLNKLG